jgi:CarD family transcriptional regulator
MLWHTSAVWTQLPTAASAFSFVVRREDLVQIVGKSRRVRHALAVLVTISNQNRRIVWNWPKCGLAREGDIADLPRRSRRVFNIGDKVVYPHHGAGTVVQKETKEVLGEQREYLTIKILHNDMTVMVPADNVDKAGLRKVIGEDTVEEVLGVIQGGGTKMPKNWNRRFKHNRDKMKTGDIFELAEVVRNLSIREGDKGLSTGEKQMYSKAKKILASELMYAKDMTEEQADEYLEGMLAEVAEQREKDGTAHTIEG